MTIPNLLRLVKLLDGAVHALLENGNLLILLLSQTIHVSGSIVQLNKEVVDLKLLSLYNFSESQEAVRWNTRLTLNESSSSCICRLNLVIIVDVSELFDRDTSSARSFA